MEGVSEGLPKNTELIVRFFAGRDANRLFTSAVIAVTSEPSRSDDKSVGLPSDMKMTIYFQPAGAGSFVIVDFMLAKALWYLSQYQSPKIFVGHLLDHLQCPRRYSLWRRSLRCQSAWRLRDLFIATTCFESASLKGLTLRSLKRQASLRISDFTTKLMKYPG